MAWRNGEGISLWRDAAESAELARKAQSIVRISIM